MASNRRQFLHNAGAAAAGTALLSSASYAQVAGANERMIVGVVGCGGMGSNHLRVLAGQNDVRIAMVCDPDSTRVAAAAKRLEGANAPQAVGDMRRVFENRDVNAVFIATPDHWHGPAAILAASAGKHVYVEKPCAHNIREGRLMIEAARRNRKVMQVGTQSRSTEHVRTAMQLLSEGAIGEVLVAKAWNSQMRRNIGRGKPSAAPNTIDYDMWVGPAPLVPYQSNRLHYNWHWWYNFGTGDMGNDGVHDLDIARWGLGVDTHPTTVAALGGKHFFDDDQQFPDTQYVAFEYAAAKGGHKKMLIFEQRIWSPYTQEGFENGNAFYGTRGLMILGKGGGWRLYGPGNKELRSMTGSVDVQANQRNFFECIRTSNRPNADIEINHLSSTLCHLGNLAARVRRVLTFNPETEEVHNDKEAGPLVRREYREGHWAVPRGV